MKRLNITIPEKVAEAIEVYENKSKFITEAIVEKINKDKKQNWIIFLLKDTKRSTS